MKKCVMLVFFAFSLSAWAQNGQPTPPAYPGSYMEVGVGVGFPWDVGPSFWAKFTYGKMIDSVLSIQGGVDYLYSSRSERLSNTTAGGVTTTILESDVQVHILKALAGIRINWPWVIWEPMRFFTQADVGYSVVWSFYSRLTDRQLFFYAGDFLTFQIMPGVVFPLGEKSQAVMGISVDIVGVSRSTPLGEFLVKERINLSGVGAFLGIGFRW